MADRIQINFTADVAGVTAGANKITEDLDSIDEALSDVARSGKDLSDDLIRSFLESERAAGKSAEEIERVLVRSYAVPADAAKRMARITVAEFDDIERSAEDLGDGVEKAGQKSEKSLEGVGDKAGDVGTVLGDLGGAAKDALDGDLAGAASRGVDALAGMAAVVPGIGAAIGVVAAEGIGALIDGFSEAQKAVDETKARIGSMYETATQDGRAFLDEAQIQAEVLRALFDADSTARNQAEKDAADLGLTTIDLLRAAAGDQGALNEVLDRTNQLQSDYNQKLTDANTPTEKRAALMTSEKQNVDELLQRYGGQQAILDENAKKAEAFLAYQKESTAEADRTNNALGTPINQKVTIVPDTSQLDFALSPRRITANVDVGLFYRNGVVNP